MSSESTEVVVVGAGQAGIAMSEHLSARGVPHVVLEKNRPAERWRSERWDSLVANGPAWHDRFPGLAFDGLDPDAFATKDEVVEYLAAYAELIEAPIRSGVEVTSVRRNEGRSGFEVCTSAGVIDAQFVVSATGAFQRPVIPRLIPTEAAPTQLHSSEYRNPQQLPQGAVLVVGAGSSGVQIADELRQSGRRVYLSVGPHDRPPRAYRGRDYCWWLGVLGLWDLDTPPQGAEHVTIVVSGARGSTVDFRDLADAGIELVGMTESYDAGTLRFAPDLGKNLVLGDSNYLALLRAADEYVARNGLDLPTEPEAHVLADLPARVADPILELNLADDDVTSIVWATGFAGDDFAWLQVDAFDENGKPNHSRGTSSEPGVYFLGLPWLSRRGSSFIWGVWHDALHIADQISIQRSYRAVGSSTTR